MRCNLEFYSFPFNFFNSLSSSLLSSPLELLTFIWYQSNLKVLHTPFILRIELHAEFDGGMGAVAPVRGSGRSHEKKIWGVSLWLCSWCEI